MPPTSKKNLLLIPDDELQDKDLFKMAGIVSLVKGYSLCWYLNSVFNLNLIRTDDLYFKTKKGADMYIQCYECADEEAGIHYRLLGNRSTAGLLAPEHKNTDFLFIAKGDLEENKFDNLIILLKNTTFAALSYKIDINGLKNRELLYY